MPRPNPGPQLKLYGPDTRHGAKKRAAFKRYLWYIVWTEKGRKREQATGAGFDESPTPEGRAEAEKALRDFLDGRSASWRGVRNPDQVTIADALDFYADERGKETIDPDRIDDCITALVGWWGDQTVSAVSANTCRRYAKERDRSANTIRRELGVLKAAIRYCHREGKLSQEVPVVMPDKPPARELWLTRTEAALLLRAARKEPKARLHLTTFIFVGLYTGHRKTAILELQWQPNTVGGHVDLERRRIDFQGRRPTTKKRRAKIAIPQRLMTFLRYARRRTRQYVIEDPERHSTVSERKGSGLGNIKRSFATACREAARMAEERAQKENHPDTRAAWLETAAKFREATPHILRHTRVTWLVAKGVPYADIGEFVGMSPEMVERVYGHHSPEQGARVLKAIDGR